MRSVGAREVIRPTNRGGREISVDRGGHLVELGESRSRQSERDADPDALSESERAELKRLRKENVQLATDMEILRKAAAPFARRRTGDRLPVRRRSPSRPPHRRPVPHRWCREVELLRVAHPNTVRPPASQRRVTDRDSREPRTIATHVWGAPGHGPVAATRPSCRPQPRGSADGRQPPGRSARTPKVSARPAPQDRAGPRSVATRLHRGAARHSMGCGRLGVHVLGRKALSRRDP